MRPPLNTLFYGDCLDVMTEWDADVADLVYLDPPFNSNASYLFKSADLTQTAFDDTWRWDAAAEDRALRLSVSDEEPVRNLFTGFGHARGRRD